jgi:hypothetical protein
MSFVPGDTNIEETPPGGTKGEPPS